MNSLLCQLSIHLRYVLISDQDLSGAEVELVNEYGREFRLKEAI